MHKSEVSPLFPVGKSDQFCDILLIFFYDFQNFISTSKTPYLAREKLLHLRLGVGTSFINTLLQLPCFPAAQSMLLSKNLQEMVPLEMHMTI
jgi:hypothetical protein